ncbi:MAG TPA: hypothetical protein VMT92_06815 [Steroidobacteraceae bacterium]|nr:hypothetical protein [Steroidobacteraceae bacterium]
MNRGLGVLLVLIAALAACDHDSHISIHTGGLTLKDGRVVIHGSDGTEATVSKEGEFSIAGKPIGVTEGERADLTRYYRAANDVVGHAAATGVAGAKVGVTAADAVVTGLAKGDMSEVKGKVQAQAEEVKRQALKLCDDIKEVRAAQEVLRAALPAFQPYAVVGEHDVTDCGKDVHDAGGSK